MKKNIAPLFIMTAASLWAIDAIFRAQLSLKIPPASIVFFEHLLGFLLLSPFFMKSLPKVKKLGKSEWVNLIALTVVSSAMGTILFTEALSLSFATFDFVTPILLQKLQPIFVILMSAVILKERVTYRFLGLATMALIGSYMISFGTNGVTLGLQGKELVYLLSISATFCWGVGTILSKNALKKLDFQEATALRFLLAIPVALLFAIVLGQTYNFMNLNLDQILRFIIIASITGGAFAVTIYYKGLQHTEAKISTIAELMFPIVSILIAITPLNPYGQPQVLSLANVFGIVILLLSILMISFDKMEK